MQGGNKTVIVGAALLRVPEQLAAIGADGVVLVRGAVHGTLSVEREKFTGDGADDTTAVELHDVADDVTWCYLAPTKILFVGSHTGSTAYAIDIRQMGIIHRLVLHRVDEAHLRKFAFIPTPDRRRVLLLCEERVVGFALDGAIILNRTLQVTDQFLEVSNAGLGIEGIEYEERVYFEFPLPSERGEHGKRSRNRQQTYGSPLTDGRDQVSIGVPDVAFETSTFEIGWAIPHKEGEAASPNALGVALSDPVEMFLRTQFGIFPTYPVQEVLLLTLARWMQEIVRLVNGNTGARQVTLYLGTNALYCIRIGVHDQLWYLHFTRQYLPADLDLLPPVVMPAERFTSALFETCEHVQRLIEVSGIQTAETRAFTAAFARFQRHVWRV